MYAFRPYLSAPKSSTRSRISIGALRERGTFVQPVAGRGAASGNGAWPANPSGWSNCRPNAATKLARSVGAM